MTKVIRRASEADLEDVHRLEAMSFRDPYPRGFLKALFQIYPDTSLVAVNNGRVVGYVVASADRGDGHLISIAVHPMERRRKVGEALMRELVTILRRRGVTLLRLEVRKTNELAQRFYQKLGFEFSHAVPHYYHDEDGLVFYKVLDRAPRRTPRELANL